MSVVIVKTGFSIVAAIVLIALLQTTTAMDAILLFAASGVVPGTDIQLTPEATLWVLGGVAVLSMLLIFSTNIFRTIRSMFRRVRQPRAAVAAPAAMAEVVPEVAPEPVLAEAFIAKPEPPKPVVIIKLPGKPGHISRMAHVVRTAMESFVLSAAAQAPVVWREAVSRAQYSLGVAKLYVAYGWRWLAPRAVRVGRLVQGKLQQHQDITFIIDFLRAVSKVANKWWAETRRRLNRYMAKISS